MVILFLFLFCPKLQSWAVKIKNIAHPDPHPPPFQWWKNGVFCFLREFIIDFRESGGLISFFYSAQDFSN